MRSRWWLTISSRGWRLTSASKNSSPALVMIRKNACANTSWINSAWLLVRTSHKGLGISEADWDAAAKHLVAALDKYKVPEAEKNDLLAFVVTQKKDIVEK